MDAALAKRLNESFDTEIKELQKISKSLNDLMQPRSKLMTQKSENEMVQKEFKLLKSDAVVYKLVGPVLVKQELDDAKTNVDNRVNGRIEKQTKDLSEKLESQRKKVSGMQGQMKKIQQEAIQKQLKAQAGK